MKASIKYIHIAIKRIQRHLWFIARIITMNQGRGGHLERGGFVTTGSQSNKHASKHFLVRTQAPEGKSSFLRKRWRVVRFWNLYGERGEKWSSEFHCAVPIYPDCGQTCNWRIFYFTILQYGKIIWCSEMLMYYFRHGIDRIYLGSNGGLMRLPLHVQNDQ